MCRALGVDYTHQFSIDLSLLRWFVLKWQPSSKEAEIILDLRID